MFELKPLKKPNAQQQQPARKVHKSFNMDDDDEPTQKISSGAHIQNITSELSKISHKKMLDETSKYILEDPTIFEYDTHYDQYTEKRQELEQQKKQKVGAKYIHNIIKTTEKRKIEQSMIYEKIAEKELIREGENAGGQKYVTASYKKLMTEGQKFQEEDAAKEAYNKQHTIENKDNVLGLYKDMYKNDMFAGGYRPDIGTLINQPQQPAPKEVPINPAPVQEQVQESPQQAQKDKSGEVAPNQQAPIVSGREVSAKKPVEEITKSRNADAVDRERERGNRDIRRKSSKSRSRSRSKSPSRVPVEAKEVEAKKENKEDKLKSAKERYLQRKLNQNATEAAANTTTDQPQV